MGHILFLGPIHILHPQAHFVHLTLLLGTDFTTPRNWTDFGQWGGWDTAPAQYGSIHIWAHLLEFPVCKYLGQIHIDLQRWGIWA